MNSIYIITINIISSCSACIGIMFLIHIVEQWFTPTVLMSRSVFKKSNEHSTTKRGKRKSVILRSVGIVSFHSFLFPISCSFQTLSLTPTFIPDPVINAYVHSRVVPYLYWPVLLQDTVVITSLPRISTECPVDFASPHDNP